MRKLRVLLLGFTVILTIEWASATPAAQACCHPSGVKSAAPAPTSTAAMASFNVDDVRKEFKASSEKVQCAGLQDSGVMYSNIPWASVKATGMRRRCVRRSRGSMASRDFASTRSLPRKLLIEFNHNPLTFPNSARGSSACIEAHASHSQEHSRNEAAVKGDRREPWQRACPLTVASAKGTPLLQ